MISQRNSLGGLVVAALLAFLAGSGFLAISAAGALASTGSISGTVSAAATGQPLEGVEVCAYPTNWYYDPEAEGNAGGCTHTGADGTYTIGDLESENNDHTVIGYEVQFRPDDEGEEEHYFWQYYSKNQGGYPADVVPVTSGAVAGIDAQLQSPGRIEGSVIAAESGLPVEGVEVCAWEVEGWGLRCGRTAADGSYAIPIRSAGEYEIEFNPWRVIPGLAFQFFDHQDRWSGAEILAVGLSETITGIDAALLPGASISGHVTKAVNGQALNSIQVCSIDAIDNELWTCAWTGEDGSYELPSLSDGPYKVVFSPEPEEWEGLEAWEDGFPTQFWGDKATLSEAAVLSVVGSEVVTGVDAHLGPLPPLPAPAQIYVPPAAHSGETTLSAPSGPSHERRNCGHGHRPKQVHGQRRCFGPHHRHKHHAKVKSQHSPSLRARSPRRR